jgi:hypothetical protein
MEGLATPYNLEQFEQLEQFGMPRAAGEYAAPRDKP